LQPPCQSQRLIEIKKERKKRSEHLGGKKNFDHQSGEKKTRVNSRRKREYPPIEE
jgi:hypothetical protein